MRVIEKIKLLWDFSILSSKVDSFGYHLKIIRVYPCNATNKGDTFLDYLHLHAFLSKKIEDCVNIQRTSRIIDEVILKSVQVLSPYRIDIMSLRRHSCGVRGETDGQIWVCSPTKTQSHHRTRVFWQNEFILLHPLVVCHLLSQSMDGFIMNLL